MCEEPGVHHRLHRVEHAGHGRSTHPSHHCTQHQVGTLVHILDGKLESGARVRSNFFYLICLGHLFRSRADTNRIFFSEKTFFLYACATCSELPYI